MPSKSGVIDFLRKWRVHDYGSCAVLGVVGAVVGTLVQPHCRSFDFEDTNINKPSKDPATFPTYSVIIAVVLVTLIYAVGEYFTWRKQGKQVVAKHLNAWVLVQAFSVCLDYCIVNLSKLYAGRLRPNFLDLLQKEGITESNFDQFSNDQICRAAREGRLSFPSGHASTTFSGFVPLVLYLLGRTRALRGGTFHTAVTSLLPLVLPLVTAISRTRDNDHHFSDIVAGAVVGTFSAVFSVFISFAVGPTGDWMIRSESFSFPPVVDPPGSNPQNPIDKKEHRMNCAANSPSDV